ncbi:hypothetical protein TA3x_003782 [Tundrisphaera sp. TA3]|uniref:hypothetical protein n=1 Tax=Tundrisphaera sp. TA3 TaxID=3435775 RepID=UPI003EBE2CAB
MRKSSHRRITISDAIILVAATAAALGATRHSWAFYFEFFKPGGDAYRFPFPDTMFVFRDLLFSISFFPAAWSLAVLWLGIRQPRPRFGVVTRQPGMTAALATVVVLAIQLANFAASFGFRYAWLGPLDYDTDTEGWIGDWFVYDFRKEPPLIPSMVGCAVAATWIVQAASGRWKPKPNGIDRLGRALGWYWMATIPFSWFSWNV